MRNPSTAVTARMVLNGSGALAGFHPDFYFRAFDGLVTRTAAGYHYSGNWASSTDGIFTR